jgi:hypothetical protein
VAVTSADVRAAFLLVALGLGACHEGGSDIVAAPTTDTGASTQAAPTTSDAMTDPTTSGDAPARGETTAPDGDDGSDGTTYGATTGSSDDAGATLGAPPQFVLSSATAAAGGWLFAVVDTPLVHVDLALDHHRLGDPDERIDVAEPIGVWRVPSGLAPGVHEFSVFPRDAPANRTIVPIEITAPAFVDIAAVSGLANLHDVAGSPDECAKSHTGIAAGDFDGDGRLDLFVGNVGAPSRLFRQQAAEPLAFEEVAEAVGLGGIDEVAMATFIDVDGDGDLDLFVGRRGTNRLYRNRLVPDGTTTFEDASDETGVSAHSQRTMGAAFGDYDGDGDLDLYVVNHAWCYPEVGSEIRAEDHLYRNDDGIFVERTDDLSPVAGRSAGFSAVWVDIERDGDQDLFVVNDDVGGVIGDPNELWVNQGLDEAPGGAWKFVDASVASGVAISGVEGMGLGLGDVDGDGFVDFAISNTGANVLLHNRGDGTFEDRSAAAGIERAKSPWDRTSVTWATHLWDRDNDGDLDLYYAGGAVTADVPVPDAMLDNAWTDDDELVFVDRTWSLGLSDPSPGKGSLVADLDGDGALDLVTAAWNAPLRVWHNRGVPAGHHWLAVALRGRGGNRAAIGAVVEVVVDGVTQTCFHTQRPSLGAGGDLACHFGLGMHDAIDALRVIWPDGGSTDVTPPDVDRRIVVAAD